MGEGVYAVAAVRSEAPTFDPQLDEFSRITDRQQSQNYLIEEGENRRIRANPKRE